MSTLFTPAPAPKTPLGEYRILSPSAGVRVSPLALGAMSLGNAWHDMMGGSMTKEEVFALLDTYYDAGGNFIDTANNYQDEQSEMWIGEWMAARKNRDEIVLATKYTIGYTRGRKDVNFHVNYTGNSAKSLHISLRDSLTKLQTSYVDILYLHWWDWTTSVPEVMQSLDALVKSGKVLYLGISDSPAWIVAKANEYARAHGMAQFVIYQGKYNVALRDLERDVFPMARMEGMAIAPWGVLGQGRFRTPAQIAERLKEEGSKLRGSVLLNNPSVLSESEQKVSAALEKVAQEVGGGASLGNVAIAYVLHKQTYVFPIIGGRKPEYLLENIKALSIRLTPEQVEFLDKAIPFDLGFPSSMIGIDPAMYPNGRSRNQILNHTSRIQFVKASQPIESSDA